MSGMMLQVTLKTLDRWLPAPEVVASHRTGRQGEEDAYFYLRRLGYVIIGRNYRSPRRRGEIDLIGWDEDMLCFVEVKTRTTHDVKPAEAAVDREKRRELRAMAQEYLRRFPTQTPWRFDVLSVYHEVNAESPRFELFRHAFSSR